MKRINFIIIVFLCIITLGYSQTPPSLFNYSAVARDVSGQPIAGSTIGIKISIIKTSINGATVYVEDHIVNTDAFGLFNIVIGGGTLQSGSMALIDWSIDNYYLEVSMDPTGGNNFLIMGTTQLLSVPYAMHSRTADSIVGGNFSETDPVFGLSVSSGITSLDTSSWNNKLDSFVESDPLYSSSASSGITTGDTSNWNNKQNLLISGTGVSIIGDTIHCNCCGNCFTHYIGEYFGGGVIFHLWKDNQGVEHGLVVDIHELSTNQPWSNIDQTLIGNAAQSSWDGLSNTNGIVAQSGHTNSAASLCLNSNNSGQSDWYLPSIDELSLLWHNRFNVSKTLSTIVGSTQFSRTLPGYLSSTELSATNVSIFLMHGGAPNSANKSLPYYVRAIRSF
jgi:hypothetical protein